jgi:hypothetical protein
VIFHKKTSEECPHETSRAKNGLIGLLIGGLAGKITAGVREKAGELKQLGQGKLIKQMDCVSTGKAAVEAA